eukprot:305250-Prorocentrum_minimum.AAC.1
MTRSFALPLLGRKTRGQGALRQAYLSSPRPNFTTRLQASVTQVSPRQFWHPHTFREFSVNRLEPPIRGPTLSRNRSSARRQRLDFPPLIGLGARASCPSSLDPAGLPLGLYKQAALSSPLVRAIHVAGIKSEAVTRYARVAL